MWLNVGCGTHRAPAPWWNIDTVQRLDAPTGDTINPDQIINPDQPLPFPDNSCDRILLSHVLEHVPWEQVPTFLDDIHRLATGPVLLVGPDAYRCIHAYAAGQEPWYLLASVLEHKNYPPDMADWPGAPHHWNCHEARVVEALHRGGWTTRPATDTDLSDWPVVAWNARWQFAVVAHPQKVGAK